MPREMDLTPHELALADRVAGALWALSAAMFAALGAWASVPAYAG